MLTTTYLHPPIYIIVYYLPIYIYIPLTSKIKGEKGKKEKGKEDEKKEERDFRHPL